MPMLLPKAYVYTDGSSGADRRGGYAAIVATSSFGVELWGCESETTNNRMELMGAIKGMKFLGGEPYEITLVSDSAYMLNSIKNGWYLEWLKSKKPRKNIDLWRDISELLCYHTVTTIKVKGHSGIEHNERVDKLARYARIERDDGIEFLYGGLL